MAEYGGVHGATCLDYDPTQRVLAVGVDVGVKILGADGLEALLPTLHHVEPALSVEFVPSTARVARLSVEGGIDVWCLRTQTLLASTRWPEELTVARGVPGTPFFFLGEASGAMRVAAVQAGGDGGVLAPRSYAVAPGAARPDEPDARAALVATALRSCAREQPVRIHGAHAWRVRESHVRVCVLAEGRERRRRGDGRAHGVSVRGVRRVE